MQFTRSLVTVVPRPTWHTPLTSNLLTSNLLTSNLTPNSDKNATSVYNECLPTSVYCMHPQLDTEKCGQRSGHYAHRNTVLIISMETAFQDILQGFQAPQF